MTEQELKHYGIMGMHWGVRRFNKFDRATRNQRVAEKLSRKYGIEIGEGVSDRHIKGSIKNIENGINNVVANAKRARLTGMMSEKEYSNLIGEIERTKIVSIKKNIAKGKARYEAQLKTSSKPSSVNKAKQGAVQGTLSKERYDDLQLVLLRNSIAEILNKVEARNRKA